MENEVNTRITEEVVLNALNYESPEKIIVLCIPARTCRVEEEVYGHTYLTKLGKRIFELAEKKKIPSLLRIYNTFKNNIFTGGEISLKDLEEAIKQYPNDFDPKGESSIFSLYSNCKVVVYDEKHVGVILCPDIETQYVV